MSIKQDIMNGKKKFKCKNSDQYIIVNIDTGGIGGRYRAFIDAPYYTTMVETPDMVNKEPLSAFATRLESKILEIQNEAF